MKFILMTFAVLYLACGEVLAGSNADLSFYYEGQLVKTRDMTEDEIRTFEELEISNQVMAIIDKRNGQSDADTKRIIDKFLSNKGVGGKLKQALNSINMSLEFDLSAKDPESTTLEVYAEQHHKTSANFKKDISSNLEFVYDEIRVAGKKLI
ncbi:MAG: hypothetical protein JKY88_07635 [Pseudomonadales bacterium]|nr:hypothetical protein [Pseudomonadales bacterium]